MKTVFHNRLSKPSQRLPSSSRPLILNKAAPLKFPHRPSGSFSALVPKQSFASNLPLRQNRSIFQPFTAAQKANYTTKKNVLLARTYSSPFGVAASFHAPNFFFARSRKAIQIGLNLKNKTGPSLTHSSLKTSLSQTPCALDRLPLQPFRAVYTKTRFSKPKIDSRKQFLQGISKKQPMPRKKTLTELPRYRRMDNQLLTKEQLLRANKKPLPDDPVPEEAESENSVQNVAEFQMGQHTFQDLGFDAELVESLTLHGIKNPSQIQMLAAPAILKGQDVLLASATGTGKTFAYLLPIIQALLDQQKQPDFRKKGQRASCLILVPSRELVYQVWQFAENVMQKLQVPLRVYGWSPYGKEKVEMVDIHKHIDILVSTPQRFLFHYKTEHIYIDQLKFLVVDEADTMLDHPWDSEIGEVIHELKARIQGKVHETQVAFVTATVTKSVQGFIEKNFSKKFNRRPKVLVSDDLHKLLSNIKQKFYLVPNERTKREKLHDLLRKLTPKKEKVIIFCNSVTSCFSVSRFLKDNRFVAVTLSKAISKANRETKFISWLQDRTKILVTTDIASRGLDFANVNYVVLYDFPLNVINYVHRVGRTGRFTQEGTAISYYYDTEQMLVDSIQTALQNKDSIESIPILSTVHPKSPLRSHDV